MAKSRDEITRKAMEQGVEVPAGIVEASGAAVGLEKLPTGAGAAAEAPAPAAPTGYWRVRIVPHAKAPEPGDPDHVVRAPDEANAWAVFCREMGVIDTDRQVNRVVVEAADRTAYCSAQAKRFRVDLRDQPGWQPA